MAIKHHTRNFSDLISAKSGGLVIYIVASVILFFLGYFAHTLQSQNSQDQAIQEIFSGTMFGSSLQGKITAVSQNAIMVEVSKVYGLNLPKDYQTKTLSIDSNTKIILSKQKTAEEFSKELAEAKAKAKGNMMAFTPPAPFMEQSLTINDLKPDTRISFSVDPSQNKGILDSEYKAVEIIVGQINF